MSDKKSEVESQLSSNVDSEEESLNSDDEQHVPIDLSENEVYRGICTLFEDEDGNNMLEYISLLHTELIGINKSLENLRLIRKEMTRIADFAELFVKGKKSDDGHHKKTETTVLPTETSVRKKK